MVTEFDRNVRTLIVSFVIAIMAMIPLRFIEVGQQLSLMPGATVLGESVEVVLPESPMMEEESAPVLEAPYDEIESRGLIKEETIKPEAEEILLVDNGEDVMDADEESQVLGAETECVSAETGTEIIAEINQQIARGNLSSSERDRMITEVLNVQNNICR